MTLILSERLCVEINDGLVVFAIGMRINKPLKVWRWLPVFQEMAPILREQEGNPDIGMLCSRPIFGLRNIGVLQLWRSAKHLENYAHQANGIHLEAWKRFNNKVGTNGDVGIWHETYVVPAGGLEAIYVNMPRYGLGLVSQLLPATGPRSNARKRLEERM